jgi:hypothetical protein
MLAAHPAAAKDYRFEADPVASMRENFVACEVLSQLQRSWKIPASCSPANASRCTQYTGSVSKQAADHLHASIRTT